MHIYAVGSCSDTDRAVARGGIGGGGGVYMCVCLWVCMWLWKVVEVLVWGVCIACSVLGVLAGWCVCMVKPCFLWLLCMQFLLVNYRTVLVSCFVFVWVTWYFLFTVCTFFMDLFSSRLSRLVHLLSASNGRYVYFMYNVSVFLIRIFVPCHHHIVCTVL